MSQTQTNVISQHDEKEHAELAHIHAKYEEILSRFAQSSPTPREKVLIEKRIIETFQKFVTEEDIDPAQRRARENIADAVTAVSATLSAVAAVSGAANSVGTDLPSLAWSLIAHSSGLFGSAAGLSPVLLSVVSLFNVFRALQMGKRIKSVHENFIKWDKYYMTELDKAQVGVERAVEELSSYFVQRETLLHMKDPTKTSMLEYELGMQMTRCMSQVEYKLTRYQTLIDKAAETLEAIEHNAVELEDSVNRQKRRGWVFVVTGGVMAFAGVAMIAASGGTMIPIATAILGAVGTAAGRYIVYLSDEQLATLREVRSGITAAKQQLDEHRRSCQEFEERILNQLHAANEYVTEADKDAKHLEEQEAWRRDQADKDAQYLEERKALERQLAEARAQNAAVANRLGPLCESVGENKRQIQEVLTRYRLEKFCDLVMNLGIDAVEDLELIDEEALANAECGPIVKKRLLKMARELAEN